MKDLRNELGVKHGVDLITRLMCLWWLGKGMAVYLEYLRGYMLPEYTKMLSDAKAKYNHFVNSVGKSMGYKDMEISEEDAMELIELIEDFVAKKYKGGK